MNEFAFDNFCSTGKFDFDKFYSAEMLGAASRNPMPNLMALPQFSMDTPISLSGKHIRFGYERNLPLLVPKSLLKLGLLFSGSALSGKTNVIRKITSDIISDLGDDELAVVFVAKEDDYFSLCMPDDIVIGSGKYNRHWNLFLEVMASDDIEVAAAEMSEYLYRGRGSSEQPFFVNAAKLLTEKTITEMIRLADRTGDYSQLTNFHLKHFLTHASAAHYKELLINDQELVNNLIGETTDQSSGILSEIILMCNQVLIGGFGKCGTFSIKQAAQNMTGVLFLSYDISRSKTLGPLFSSLVDMFIAALQSAPKRGRVYLFIDEFTVIQTKIEMICTALNLMREKISVIGGVQNSNQVISLYKDEAPVILSAFQSHVYLRTGDGISAEYTKRLLGPAQRASVGLKIDTNELIENHGTVFAVDERELQTLPTGQAVVKFFAHEPFIYRFDEYVPKEGG